MLAFLIHSNYINLCEKSYKVKSYYLTGINVFNYIMSNNPIESIYHQGKYNTI